MRFWNQKTAEQWLFMPCPSAVTPIKMISLLITWSDCRIYFTNQRGDFSVCVHDASKITNQALSQFSGVREQIWNNSLTWVQLKPGPNRTFNLNLDGVPWGIDIRVYLSRFTADVDGRCRSRCFFIVLPANKHFIQHGHSLKYAICEDAQSKFRLLSLGAWPSFQSRIHYYHLPNALTTQKSLALYQIFTLNNSSTRESASP